MHQILLQLGLCPRPRLRSLQHSPRLHSWIKGDLLLRGRSGTDFKGGKEKGREGKGQGKGRKGKEREGECIVPPPVI